MEAPAPDANQRAGTAPRVAPVAVVVPTVPGREAALRRCLEAVQNQTVSPAEVVVVRGCSSYVSALRSGIAQTSTEWIAFTDDDAVPQTDWLETLVRHFNASVGAVGGRIVNFVNGRATATEYVRGPVARIGWFGRTQSHLHDRPLTRIVENVDYLPGANMCFRRAALPRIDENLDLGMAPGLEIALCVAVRGRGWNIMFDSDAIVAHYPEPRPAHLDRDDERRAAYEYSYLLTYTLLTYLPWPRKIAFLAYFILLGQRRSPGILFAPPYALNRDKRQRLHPAWAGKFAGIRDAVRPRNRQVRPVS